MGALEKIKTEILRKTVVEGDEWDLDDVLILTKESRKGVSIYKIYLGVELDEEFSEVNVYYGTHSRERAEKYFSKLESRYPESRLTRKIF